MARDINKGLAYIPIDVNILSDRKISRLRRACGEYAPYVYIVLLLYIGKESYYVDYNDDSVLDIADLGHLDVSYVTSVLEQCVKVGLLSKEMFEEQGVLTSVGIQRQYEKICKQAGKSSRVKEFSLLQSPQVSPENGPKSAQSPQVSPENEPKSAQSPQEMQSAGSTTDINSQEMQQSKVKKSKVNSSSPLPPSPSEEAKGSEEKEKGVYFFTFSKNFQNPNAEYEKMVAFNSLPGVEHKWPTLTDEEKGAIMQLWQQKPEQPKRYGAKFCAAWQKVYDSLAGVATYQQRMALLDDRVEYKIDGDTFHLFLPKISHELLERNIALWKGALWPLVQRAGCKIINYKLY